MKLSLILGAFWVVAATITALLPMRRQMVPGLALLVLATALTLPGRIMKVPLQFPLRRGHRICATSARASLRNQAKISLVYSEWTF